MKITCQTLQTDIFTVTISKKSMVIDLKEKISKTRSVDIKTINLSYLGIIMKDDKKITDYNVTNSCKIIVGFINPDKFTNTSSSSDLPPTDMIPTIHIIHNINDDTLQPIIDRLYRDVLENTPIDPDPNPDPDEELSDDDIQDNQPENQPEDVDILKTLSNDDYANIVEIMNTCNVSFSVSMTYYISVGRDKNLACCLIFEDS